MKRLFIFITVVCALFATSCYEDSTTNDRISNLENDKIASIEEQINAILSTLSVLKEETHPLILSKIGVLESNAESNAELIATLKAQAESVANQISELTNHCKQLEDSIGLYGEKEWIESTFATLEQYANMQSVVASLQANIAGLSEEVKNSIAEVENSMKSWISVQLSSYCTIAEMESKLAELRAENKDNDAAVANKIAELEKMFEAVYHEITEAYKQSIADAISNNNGEINKKIAKDIATAEARIDSKLETINAEINDIKERLHIVEVKVGDIESQITEINTTLDLLQKVDEILSNELTALEAESYELCQQYAAEIEALRVQIANLEAEKAQIQADMATNTANIEVLKDAHNACIELIQSLDSKISNITMVMHAYMDEVSMRIENIRAEQEMLKAQIATLQEYVENELSQKADKDWAEATFATLEQYAQMQNLLDALQKQISSLDKNGNEEGGVDSSAIQEAINAAEESMKGWVSEQLAGYCTISQLEAELATLRQELANNEAISQAQVLELQAQIDSLHKLLYDMKAEYLQTLNMIEAAMMRQDDSICAILEEINAKICPSINEIKNQIDDLWEFISKRIQSITYIPKYTDEKATIIKTLNVDEGVGELDFLVLPKQAVQTIQVSDVSLNAVETISRAVTFVDMPVLSIKANSSNGVLTVLVSGKNLGDDFYEGKKEFKATLIISNGENEISSEFITLTPQVEEGNTSTNNKIFYTSSDGNVVTPNATNVFGANIVSNTYTNGQGVITFDGEVTTIGKEAFKSCSSLTSVTIGNSVTTIGEDAFYNCSSLTSISIPKSVTSIKGETFGRCSSLKRVDIADLETWCRIDFDYLSASNPLSYAGNLYLNGELVEDLVIPESITEVGWAVFYGAKCLKSVTFHNRVTSIEGWAFRNCSSLESITIPESVTSIGFDIFSGCDALKAFYGKFASADNRCLIMDGVLKAFAPAGLTEYTILDRVTEIGRQAFIGCRSLTSVTIPDSVTSIGNQAFNSNYSLKEVYCMPTTPPSLGSSAFNGNASDRKIYVPAASLETYKAAEGWKVYADYIFPMPEESQNNKIFYTSSDGNVVTPNATNVFGANIVSNTYTNGQGVITFDGEVTTIGKEAFKSCKSLTSVTIPDSVTTIGEDAFRGCTALTNINIPNSVTKIGFTAFFFCTSLTRVDIIDLEAWCKIDFGSNASNPLSEVGGEIYLNGELLEKLVIPESITYVKGCVFQGAKCLKSVNIHNKVTSISMWAFAHCDALTSITIPDSVTEIGYRAFSGCDALTSVTIGNSVTTIGEEAFYNCSALTSVTIPNSVTTIGEEAFYNCSALKAFYGKFASADNRCLIVDGVLNSFAPAGLTEYTIPDSVTTIGKSAFRSCSKLTSVTIPDSVTTIGQQAFYKCTSLKEVYCKPTTPPSLDGSSVFDGNASGRRIYVPAVSLEAYKAAEGWKEYADSIVADAQYTEIYYTSTDGKIVEPSKTSAFIGCNIISNTYQNGKGAITIDGKATAIQEQAFWGCSTLKSITLPDTITKIEQYAFANCSSLTSIVIPGSVVEMRNHIFDNCTSLITATIGEGVTYISQRMFQGCTVLTNVNLPDSVTEIGANAFSDCIALKSITIPKNVQRIGGEAFLNCSSLKTVYCKPAKPFYPGYHVFDYINDNYYYNIDCKIYVPRASIDEYKSDLFWGDYKSRTYPYDFTE